MGLTQLLTETLLLHGRQLTSESHRWLKFLIQKWVAVAGRDLAEAISKMAGPIIRPDDSLEEWARTKFGMPKIDEGSIRVSASEAVGEAQDKDEIELATKRRNPFISQAGRSVARLERLKENYRAVFVEEGGIVISEKMGVVYDSLAVNRTPTVKALKTDTRKMEARLVSVLMGGVSDELEDISQSIELAKIDTIRKRISLLVCC